MMTEGDDIYMVLASLVVGPDFFFILYVLFLIRAYDFLIRYNTNEELINGGSFNYINWFEKLSAYHNPVPFFYSEGKQNVDSNKCDSTVV